MAGGDGLCEGNVSQLKRARTAVHIDILLFCQQSLNASVWNLLKMESFLIAELKLVPSASFHAGLVTF